MYHGDVVPGFPQHPHRGFETARSCGATSTTRFALAAARFGMGDVQRSPPARAWSTPRCFRCWIATAQHAGALSDLAEPAVQAQARAALFLDAVGPRHPAPSRRRRERRRGGGHGDRRALGDVTPLPPPPDSWAADPTSDPAIWSIHLDAGALDGARGGGLGIRSVRSISSPATGCAWPIDVSPARPRCKYVRTRRSRSRRSTGRLMCCSCRGGRLASRWRRCGPFVMNTRAELEQALPTTVGPSSGAGCGRRDGHPCTGARRSASRGTPTARWSAWRPELPDAICSRAAAREWCGRPFIEERVMRGHIRLMSVIAVAAAVVAVGAALAQERQGAPAGAPGGGQAGRRAWSRGSAADHDVHRVEDGGVIPDSYTQAAGATAPSPSSNGRRCRPARRASCC